MLQAKFGIYAIIALLVSTLGLGWFAKHEYDKRVAVESSYEHIKAQYQLKIVQEAKNAAIIATQLDLERKLRREIDVRKQATQQMPDDGCLDRRMPDALIERLSG